METLKERAGGVLPEIATFEGQEFFRRPGKRSVEMYIAEPCGGVNENTGIMLVSHNWGGTWEMCKPWCEILSSKFNLICVSVNYLQSGSSWREYCPVYDHGVFQTGDCLRALYHIREYLREKKIRINFRRMYASGASGGGNISQMVNKFAPHTFGCIVDLCGMAKLSRETALGLQLLNAGYSEDPEAENYLSPAMKEIRDIGNPEHLKLQFAANGDVKIVIVHGVEDDACCCHEKAQAFANMIKAGFHVDGIFVTAAMVDGQILTTTGHQVGDRPRVIARYAQSYISEKGEFVKLAPEKNDFVRQETIVYPCTGGNYRINFSAAPEITFEKTDQ